MAAVVVAVEAAATASGACRSRSSYLVRSLYWRLRAGLRRLQYSQRATGRWRRGGGSRFSSFHYDALSYALNFDDGHASGDSLR